ncbi:MAG: hypothetical protein M1827_000784 [Pycnora praestabilis]|nr:MAG: hypothetical protein M1827_000784 [Pycnora praestabilis]
MTESFRGSPPRSLSFRTVRPPGFTPLADDVVSTRGQTLPALIQSRSSSSLHDLRHQLPQRKTSFVQKIDEEAEGELRRRDSVIGDAGGGERDERKLSAGAQALMTPQMRTADRHMLEREQYLKSDEELKAMRKPTRKYYERNNYLVYQYLYIDRLLDSSLPHDLIQEYNQPSVDIPHTISEEPSTPHNEETDPSIKAIDRPAFKGHSTKVKVKRTPKAIYKVVDEDTPLLGDSDPPEGNGGAQPYHDYDDGGGDVDSGDKIVTVAIYINLVANAVLLAGKIAVIVLTSSLSILASLVDAALDFLSTAIVWTTTRMIARQDQYSYPVGRRRLEPIGVLVFSVIMITAFFQVLLECFDRLNSGDHAIVNLTLPAIIIMAGTVVIKFACWLWCRFIKNSSVQALAQDAMTDVVFNIFSIIFPLIGYYAKLWWLDALGGLFLSLYVIINWARTSASHIRNLTGAAASADERNVLLYLTMRFAKSIRQIQGLQAYHAGDKLNVEVDIVLDENTNLRDSHDLGESLQYVLESVPTVDRAFVHQDYAGWNLPSHMQQQD